MLSGIALETMNVHFDAIVLTAYPKLFHLSTD